MWLRRLSLFAVFLACGVVALGAYTRLKDAGLGCPDWPGCYGHLVVPDTHEAIHRANEAYPDRPLTPEKAWPEMVHRYFASTLGLVIFVITWLCYKARRTTASVPFKLSLFLALLVVFQGILGMLTVTMGLLPTVVMTHLMGGFTTLCLLFLLALRIHRPSPIQPNRHQPRIMFWALSAIAVLAAQIALGGWTAANYAATICTELPVCMPGWSQHLDFYKAFSLPEHGLESYEFATHLDPTAKITIHVAHRFGALFTAIYLSGLFLRVLLGGAYSPGSKRAAILALGILTAQIGLGVSNIVFDLPLSVAVAHNGVAALLMMTLIYLNYTLYLSTIITSGNNLHEQSRFTPATSTSRLNSLA